jgi:hypothetical protein
MFYHALIRRFCTAPRTNEDNIDLNRNFREFSRVTPVNTAYSKSRLYGFSKGPPAPEKTKRAHRTGTSQSVVKRGVASRGERRQCDRSTGCSSGRRTAWSNGIFRGCAPVSRRGAAAFLADRFHYGTRDPTVPRRGGGNKNSFGDQRRGVDRAQREDMVGNRRQRPSMTALRSAAMTVSNFEALSRMSRRGMHGHCARIRDSAADAGRAGPSRRSMAAQPIPIDARSAGRSSVCCRDAFYCDADDWKAMVLWAGRARRLLLQACKAKRGPANFVTTRRRRRHRESSPPPQTAIGGRTTVGGSPGTADLA